MKSTSQLCLIILLLLGTPLLIFNLYGDDRDLKDLLEAEQGQVIADVGAGDGDWVGKILDWVGPNGTVIATEVDSGKVSRIRRKAETSGWDNVKVVLGDQEKTGLEPDSCDRVLLRLVYHHFENPQIMVSDLFRSVREKGRIAVIDFVPNSHLPRNSIPSFRDRHGVDPQEVQQQMKAVGFTFLKQVEKWEGQSDRFLLLFEK